MNVLKSVNGILLPPSVWNSGGTGSYSIKAINASSITSIGNYSVAEGFSTSATTDYAHAEGVFTLASGQASHAEGQLTQATGIASHAEGYQTQATGNYSHSEGSSSKATGNTSHAQGDTTVAGGDYSHASGGSSKALGQYSFVHGAFSSTGSIANSASTIVLGTDVIGLKQNTTYVEDFNIKKFASVPTGSTDTVGSVGSITWDDNYFYWKTISGWLRESGSTF